MEYFHLLKLFKNNFMKINKILFLMMFTISFLLISCNDEINDSNISKKQETVQERAYVYAYKTNDQNQVNTKSASLNGKTWNKGDVIRIKFLNGNTISQNKVKEIASEWLNYANSLDFRYVEPSEEADVKITFSWNEDYVTWSMIGTDCKGVAQDTPSMNLTLFDENDIDEVNCIDFTASILREFGHVLGLVYENQGPKSAFQWNQARVKNYFRQQGWTQSQIDSLMQVYSTAQTNYTEFDSQSIMLLFFPNFLTTDNTGSSYNTELSQTDKEFISELYGN